MDDFNFELAVMAVDDTKYGISVTEAMLRNILVWFGVDADEFIADLIKDGYLGLYRIYSDAEAIYSARAVAK
mgnify:CR=1 FL=1